VRTPPTLPRYAKVLTGQEHSASSSPRQVNPLTYLPIYYQRVTRLILRNGWKSRRGIRFALPAPAYSFPRFCGWRGDPEIQRIWSQKGPATLGVSFAPRCDV